MARMGKKINLYKVFTGKHKGKKPVGSPNINDR
jgi:hypothetical protein